MIVLIDYDMGNIQSVVKAFNRLNMDVLLSRDAADIEKAEKLILPGVGHFAAGMNNLRNFGLLDILNYRVLHEKVPILGICLGMQLFGEKSEEGDADGLGWINAQTVKFSIKDTLKYKVPHVGWNTVTQHKNSPLFNGLAPDDSFYFVHSYHVVCHDEGDVLATSEYENRFVSALQHDTIFGTQFHPEKSHVQGLEVIKNFSLSCF